MARTSEGLNATIVADVLDAAEGRPIVVALGGGADSAVLLAAAVHGLRDAADDTPVRAVFVRHGLASSRMLEEVAVELASDLGVPLRVLDAPVEDGPDLEARARRARYEAIDTDLQHDEIAMTAHTADDQAETIVMRLARGSGSAGLSGIPSERGPWRRPLLHHTRAELRSQADTSALPYADDPSNVDDRFTRSRIRHRVMPLLEDELPGSVRGGLVRSASLLAADETYLGDVAKRIPIRRGRGFVRIASAALAADDSVVASRAVRSALRHVRGGYPGEESDVDNVLSAAVDGISRPVSGGLVAVNEGPWVRVGDLPAPPISISAAVGDRFDWAGATYRVTMAEAGHPTVLPGGRFTVFAAASVSLPFEFRGVLPGDSMATGEGNTPVGELLRAHGIHADLRPVSLLAVDGAKIAAVVGVRTASWAAPLASGPVIVVEREVIR